MATVTNKNDIHKEIKSRLNSGNACYKSRGMKWAGHAVHTQEVKNITF